MLELGSRNRLSACMVLALATVAGTCRPERMQGVVVHLDLSREPLNVLEAFRAPFPRSPGFQLTIDARNWRLRPEGAGEFVAVVYDTAGTALTSTATPSRALDFFDAPDLDEYGSRSTRSRIDTGPRDRVGFHLATPNGAAFVGVFRTEVGTGPATTAFMDSLDVRFDFVHREDRGREVGYFGVRFVGGLRLPGRDGLPSPLPDDIDAPPDFRPPDGLNLINEYRAGEYVFPLFQEPPTQGEIVGVEHHVVASDEVDEPFNIVVLGDGFDASAEDQDAFLHLAHCFAETLRVTSPFEEQVGHWNLFIIRTESVGSEIWNCSDVSPHPKTYYRVRGCYRPFVSEDCPDPPIPPRSFIGTDSVWRIHTAAAEWIPDQTIHCFLMIANCESGAGRADARDDVRVAFVNRSKPKAELSASEEDSVFAETAIHECAHVIGKLTDEYQLCEAWDSTTTFPNVATEGQVAASDVPWEDLAEDAVEIVGGALTTIHRHGDSLCNDDHNEQAESEGFLNLGAYWGCSFIDFEDATEEEAAGACNKWQDLNGVRFYRPMARCKMRWKDWDFCRVCSTELEAKILNPPD